MKAGLIGMILTSVTFFVASTSHGVTYEYVFEQASYTASPGGMVDVLVYLQETDGTVFKDTGLIGTGVTVRFDNVPQPGSPAKVMNSDNVLNVSDFELLWSKDAQPDLGYADLSLGTFGTAYGEETATGSGVYRVLLGQFTFTAGMIANETTHIRAMDFSDSLDDTISSDYMVLDDQIQEGTATITTIPEPSGSMLLGIAALTFLAFLCCSHRLRATFDKELRWKWIEPSR